MTGQLDNGTDGKGVRYAARVRVLNRGGEISVHGNVLSVSNADEVILLIAAATDYQGFAGRQTKDPLAATLDDLNQGRQQILSSRCARRTSRIIRNISSAFHFSSNRSTRQRRKSRRPNASRRLQERRRRSEPGGAVF